jgi:hypothetical protein
MGIKNTPTSDAATDVTVWDAQVVPGTWQSFILHVTWSDNPNAGLVELYTGTGLGPVSKVYGKTQQTLWDVEQCPCGIDDDCNATTTTSNTCDMTTHLCTTPVSSTQKTPVPVFLKTGLYRDGRISEAGTLFMTGYSIATNMDAARCLVAGPDAPQQVCSNMCVDTASDPSNCGGCGNKCPSGATCSAGQCDCPKGQQRCGKGGACVDTATDVDNCGACGKVCPRTAAGNGFQIPATVNTACYAGTCVDTAPTWEDCGWCSNFCYPTPPFGGSDKCWCVGCDP